MATTSDNIYRVRVSGKESDVRQFLAKFPLESQGVHVSDGLVRLDLTVDGRQREELVRLGLRIDAQFDVFENLRQRRTDRNKKTKAATWAAREKRYLPFSQSARARCSPNPRNKRKIIMNRAPTKNIAALSIFL